MHTVMQASDGVLSVLCFYINHFALFLMLISFLLRIVLFYYSLTNGSPLCLGNCDSSHRIV